jgi:LmbE family N-acetylglucosaminyl deacetylase
MRENARVPDPRTIVFVHAHPDDEALLTAGTMARAVDAGLRVVLIVATDGAAGLTDAALAANLSLHRRAELAASADLLGVHRLETLDYPDSGLHAEVPNSFAHADRFAIARRIGQILDEEDAAIVVGYDPSGGYGHPDHLQVHRAVRAAAVLARRPPSLFEATLPREPIARAVRVAAALHLTPGDFDAASFDHAWTPRAEITHRIDVRPYLAQKTAALRAHASQATADGTTRTLAVLTRIPGPLRTLLLGTEYYVSVTGPRRTRSSARSRASEAS